MSSKHYNQIAGQRLGRIEALSDGVFAIALTLLVLDLKVPVSEAINSEGALLNALAALSPKILSYFLSFMTLGIFWTGHTAQFHFIEKSDRNLNWISLFFLLAVSVLPFTTALLSQYILFKTALGLYWLNILVMGVLLYWHWAYAEKKGLLLANEETAATGHAIKRRIIIAQSLYAAGALLCFISTYVSIAVIVLVQLNYALGLVNSISPKKANQ
jgi:uncharacterized membrane protein